MMKTKSPSTLTGVVPVIVTPFLENEEIDEIALQGLINFAAGCGVSAVCLPAYASEFYKLSEEERLRVVSVAAQAAAGKVLIIAQSNHGSAYHAARLAEANVAAGADLISIAIPRQFALSDDELRNYLSRIMRSVAVPCLVQDFNPGGPTVNAEFVRRLKAECPNFSYLKIEEPLSGPKIREMVAATDGTVGILEGWGGLYMMELIPAGICGLMPGLALADLLQKIYTLRRDGEASEAFRLFEKVLPHIGFTLQNLELFIRCEKRLLQMRGLLSNDVCRAPSYHPDALTDQYVEELSRRIMKTLREEKFVQETEQ